MKSMIIFSVLKSFVILLLLPVLESWLILLLNLIVSMGHTLYLLRKKNNPIYPVFFGVMETCLPVFSTLNLLFNELAFYVLRKTQSKKSDLNYRLPFGEEHFRRYTSSQESRIAHDYVSANQEKILYNSSQIEPFLDLIEGTDLDLKISAIGKLAQIRSRESIAILKIALDDDNYEVRYFASSSLSLMEKMLIADIEQLNRTISEVPADHGLVTKRGLAYLSMYYLGIVDPSIAHVFLEQALNNFLYSLQLKGDQTYLFVKILEIYNYLKEYERMVDIIPDILQKTISDEDRVKVQFYQAEAHFHLRRFQDLKKDCETISQKNVNIPLMQESVSLWKGLA